MSGDTSIREKILIEKARGLSDEQFEKLISFLDTIIPQSEPSQKAKDEFYELSKNLNEKVKERGLTEEILQGILNKSDENRS